MLISYLNEKVRSNRRIQTSVGSEDRKLRNKIITGTDVKTKDKITIFPVRKEISLWATKLQKGLSNTTRKEKEWGGDRQTDWTNRIWNQLKRDQRNNGMGSASSVVAWTRFWIMWNHQIYSIHIHLSIQMSKSKISPPQNSGLQQSHLPHISLLPLVLWCRFRNVILNPHQPTQMSVFHIQNFPYCRWAS